MYLRRLPGTMLEISAAVCSQNSRPNFLARVMEALRNQTLPKERWELLVIDNASKAPLESTWDLSWHPNARHIAESKLGVAFARQRAIREAAADLLIFIDDDNVLDNNYFSEALKIKYNWPVLGVWGSGSIVPDYEIVPSQCLQEFTYLLALRETTSPRWSNVPSCSDAMPWGAGLCVRASVMSAYRQFFEQSPIQIVGRQGDTLFAGEDNEISLICCKEGLGMGVFPELKLTHL